MQDSCAVRHAACKSLVEKREHGIHECNAI